MTLIVEDGNGIAGADSYATEAQADLYHENRGNTAWYSVADKEAALRKATDFMLQTYRQAWKGFRVDPQQALDWPRYDVFTEGHKFGRFSSDYLIPSNVVPVEVRNACIELALKVTVEDLNPDLTQQILSNTVGPISVTYSAASPQYKRFRAIDMMLRHLLDGNALSARVGRS